MYIFLSLVVSVGGMEGGIGSFFFFLGVVRLVDSEPKFRGGVTGAAVRGCLPPLRRPSWAIILAAALNCTGLLAATSSASVSYSTLASYAKNASPWPLSSLPGHI